MTSIDFFAIKERIVAILKADTTNLWSSTPTDKTKFRKIEAGRPTPKSINEPPLPRLWVTDGTLIATVTNTAIVQNNAPKGKEYNFRIEIVFAVEGKDGLKSEELCDDFTKAIIDQIETNYDLRTPGGLESTRLAEESDITQITRLQPPLIGDGVTGRVIRFNVIVRA